MQSFIRPHNHVLRHIVYMNFLDVTKFFCLYTCFRYTLYTTSFPACYMLATFIECSRVTSVYHKKLRTHQDEVRSALSSYAAQTSDHVKLHTLHELSQLP
jgi:hypothetical protein